MSADANGAPVLAVSDLRMEYATSDTPVTAVRSVSFDLARGERLGIVGESGCGKSSVALALMQLVEPPGRVTHGSVVLNGRDLVALGERALDRVRGNEISLIFQDPMSALDPVKRIGDQLVEALRVHHDGLSRRAARKQAAELLGEVEITRPSERCDQFPHEFSGGMRQRVVIALALANEPAVVIADEPTTALDVTTEAQILTLLDKLVAERGTSVILITHNFDVVAEFCDTVDVMYAGRVVEHGRTEDLFRHAAHPYTQALLRCVPRAGQDPSEALVSIPGAPPDLRSIAAGCAFAPRCPIARDRCAYEEPAIEPALRTRAACHYAEGRPLP